MRIQTHPTYPWIVTADASDHVVVWNWKHRQIIYELKAGVWMRGVWWGQSLRSLLRARLTQKQNPLKPCGEGAAEAPSATNQLSSAFSSPVSSIKGRHFLVVCCENKAIFLDLVTMRGPDVPKQDLDNKSLICMEFLPFPIVQSPPSSTALDYKA
ncbi:uncharacterized protein LOC18438882 [Amborella trichopoda]|uniref:uncharacterized protein LOC18438882 n=1 Tax=Amborella trichopoda TaxID=13333 RepID=UPI0009BF44FC|nr:uncharacterized protein LOC18438882 [Amborella trichopoda]|eukprot:XP_020525864.1 uncharacterized protein LOC18438882 [Amborella trichopoda]